MKYKFNGNPVDSEIEIPQGTIFQVRPGDLIHSDEAPVSGPNEFLVVSEGHFDVRRFEFTATPSPYSIGEISRKIVQQAVLMSLQIAIFLLLYPIVYHLLAKVLTNFPA